MAFRFRSFCLAVTCIAGLSASLAPAQTGEDLLWPEHVESISDAEANLRYGAEAFLYGASAAAAADLLSLLNTPRKTVADRLSLAGPCRVRSLQVSEFGVNAYSFFRCDLRQEGETGLVFQKDAGSQRRLGVLLDSEAGDQRLVFVGGSYHAEEAPQNYSRFDADEADTVGADIDKSADSVGMLHRIGANRFLIVFATKSGRGEVYEVIRD